jgi:hypothetical protein
VHVALQVMAVAAGAAIVMSTILSAVRSTVLPRADQSRIAGAAVRSARWAFRLRARRKTRFEDRDRIMAMLGPIALLTMLALWMLLIITGYTLVFLAITNRSLVRSIELSGSSMFTLGTSNDSRLAPSIFSYSEAALGLLIVALLITFLPSIYSAFTRREAGVSLLEVRAGDPPRAPAMLIRYHRIEERRYQLTELWRQWEAWFTDIEESHTTFPILVFFRSPQPERSWITAAGALLDGASFWAGCVEHPIDPDVQLCIRAGSLALRRIADSFKVVYDADPQPDGPITIGRDEWDAAMAEMEEAGMPLLADRERAWKAWRGWRVNYDAVLLRLAGLVEAPPAPWVSDRSPAPTASSSAAARAARGATARGVSLVRSRSRRR